LCFPDGSEGELLEKQLAITFSLIYIEAMNIVQGAGDI
jgi:hypothetical protein